MVSKYYKIILQCFTLFNTIQLYNSQEVCDENNPLHPIVTDFGPSDCDSSQDLYYHKFTPEGCFPGCIQKNGQWDGCNDEGPIANRMYCKPGYKCEDYTCIEDEESCTYLHQYYEDEDEKPLWMPECEYDGSFKAKQCKGDSQYGRCYCFDTVGNRIFGEEWAHKAENMTCACSRRRYELQKERDDVTLHCDSMGNYEPLQCDSGSCWCAEPQTGEVVDTVVPEAMIEILPCYDKSKVGEKYLRKCESQAWAQAKIREELKIHGTTRVSLEFILCDWDGSYGRYSIDKSRAYCTWRDNSAIAPFATEITYVKQMNCNCARDTKIYDQAGLKMNKRCRDDGNYKEVQEDDDLFYCVDKDGFPTTLPMEERPESVNQCPGY